MRWLVLWNCSSCKGSAWCWESAAPEAIRSQSPVGLYPAHLACNMARSTWCWGLTWQYRWTAPAPGEWWRACSGGQQGQCHWFSLHQSWCSLHTTPPGGRGPCPERTSLMSQKTGKSHLIGKFWEDKTGFFSVQHHLFFYFCSIIISMDNVDNSDNVESDNQKNKNKKQGTLWSYQAYILTQHTVAWEGVGGTVTLSWE